MVMGIFVESNEELGLMYQSYKDIPGIVSEFMDFIHKTVDYALHKGIPKDDIASRLKKFKADVKHMMVHPARIQAPAKDDMIDKIKSTGIEVGKLLSTLGDIRKKFRFGDNIIKGIIIKPKIYSNSIDEEELAAVNSYMTKAAESLDWIEKVLIDLINLHDQDMNLISVMNKVYFRECHETSDFMEEFIDESDCSDVMMEDMDKPSGDNFSE